MRKSLGNVVDPHAIIEGGRNSKEAPGYGADVMQLWVSSVNYIGDVMIEPQVFWQMSDIYWKLRGTLRYLLGNLHDWEADNAISYNDLPMFDKHTLFQLENVVKTIRESYDYQFFKTFQVEMLKHVKDEIIESIPYTGEYLVQGSDRVWIGVSRAQGVKCERCWNYTPQVGSSTEHPTLYGHCYKVVVDQPEPAETTD
uniref:Isoleucine--tRNA ligase n=1 Tax=Populus alba TaxID=43335 RepID=A0A4U5N8T2_POPAL|nr:Isoleucine--tRNA ligase [Populus alba]